MILKNGNLSLRTCEVADSKHLVKWWNDGKVMEHAGFPNGLGISEEQIKKDIEKTLKHQNFFIIELDDIPIGETNYRKVDEKTAEIGIKICDFSKHDQGLGTQYLKMLINHIFYDKNFEIIILDTNMKNKRSQHVYEKLGFKKKSINKDAYKNQLGEYQTSIDYELRKENYIKQH